jgi:hypothetical protein
MSKNKRNPMFSLKFYLLKKAEKKLKKAEAKKAKQEE